MGTYFESVVGTKVDPGRDFLELHTSSSSLDMSSADFRDRQYMRFSFEPDVGHRRRSDNLSDRRKDSSGSMYDLCKNETVN